MRFLIELLVSALAFYLGARILEPNIHIDGFGNAIIVALVVGLLNATIGFLLRVLTFPINFLTLGLMSFIISVLVIMLAGSMMSSFHVNGFWYAAILAIIVAVIKAVIGMIMPDTDR